METQSRLFLCQSQCQKVLFSSASRSIILQYLPILHMRCYYVYNYNLIDVVPSGNLT